MAKSKACILITVFAILAQVESGYEYQTPSRVTLQQPNQYSSLAQASQITAYNSKQSASYSLLQGNYNNVNNQNNGQYVHSSSQNLFNNNNPYNNGIGNIQSGQFSQNVQQANSIHAQPSQPVVKKHIYFHVPPPDDDRPPVPPPVTVNRKKTYNIVFIKVPSQKPNYFVNSQGFRINPYAAVEAKTLIYVLVKNPTNQLQVSSKDSSPNHEVFYVKYKGGASNAVSQLNGGVYQQNSVHSLKPGLINGQ